MPVLRLCPGCAATVTDEILQVCQSCARSVVREGKVLRFARAADLAGLTPGQIVELRQARPAAWRNDVRARHAQIVSTKT